MADPILRLNLAMSLAILAVLLLRRPVRSLLGASGAYGLWAVVPAAMLATLAPARVIHLAAPVLRAPFVEPRLPAMASEVAETAPAWVQAAPVAAGHPINWALVLTVIWLLGVVVSLGLVAWRQKRFLNQLGGLSSDAGNPGLYRARRSGGGPALVGALFPRIVLPADFELLYDAQEREVMIAHEAAHRRRGDSRINALVALTQCLAWYNPLAHLGARALRIDQELACDQAVLVRRPAARRLYAEVLLKSQLAQVDLPLGCYWPARAERPLKTRVALLASPPKGRMTRMAGTGLAGLVALSAGVAAWAAQPAHVVLATTRTLGPVMAPTAVPSAGGMGVVGQGLASLIDHLQPQTKASSPTAAPEQLRLADNTAPAEAAAPVAAAPPAPIDPNDLRSVLANGGTVDQAMAAAQAHQYFSFLAGGVDPASAAIVPAYGGGKALGVRGPDGPIYLWFPNSATGPVCTVPQLYAEFDLKAQVKITGVITGVEWITPHTLIHMRGSEPGKPDQAWEIWAGTPSTMQRAGVGEGFLREGDTVTVEGYPGKDRSCPISAIDGGPSCRVNGRDVTFADGSKVFLGSSGLPPNTGVVGGTWTDAAGVLGRADWLNICPGWKWTPAA